MNERELHRSKLQKVILLVFLQGFLLFGLSIGIGTLFERAEESWTIPDGSSIANVDVGNMTYEEAQHRLNEFVSAWKQGPSIEVETNMNDEEISIDRNLFTFKVKDTIEELHSQLDQPWYQFLLNEDAISTPLQVELNKSYKQLSDIWPKGINLEETLHLAVEQAKVLGDKSVVAVYHEQGTKMIVLGEATVSVNLTNKHLALPKLIQGIDGYQLKEDGIFSLLNELGDTDEFGIEGDELNRLATVIYSAILGTNFDIIERHSLGEIPYYSEAGLEANVIIDEKDLVFKNPNPFPYTLDFSLENQKLSLAITGPELEMSFSFIKKNSEIIKPRTIYRYDKKLSTNAERIVENGSDGSRVDIHRVTYNSKGKKINEKRLARDYYPAKPKIVMISTLQDISEDSYDYSSPSNDDTDDQDNDDKSSTNDNDFTNNDSNGSTSNGQDENQNGDYDDDSYADDPSSEVEEGTIKGH